MGTLVLMGTYIALAVLFIVIVGLVGYGAETWAPAASTLIFLFGCAFALAAAWPLAVFVTRRWDTQN